jgi:tRNA(Ile)-lysidine synthase
MIEPAVLQTDEVRSVHIGDHELWGQGRLVVQEVLLQEALQALERGLDKNTCFLCADAIADPLQIRHWQKGDRIQPYGMHGSKLVSDLLTDAKVSFIEKEKTLVLEDQKNILWVLGHRSSKHHTIHKDSKSILKLTLVL